MIKNFVPSNATFVSGRAKPSRQIKKEKFGKVLVGTQSSTGNATLEPLTGVHLSNLDLKWYTDDGETMSKTYNKYKGKTASLCFTFRVRDKKGQMISRSMMLHLPGKLGDQNEPNFELLKNGSRLMLEAARNCGYAEDMIEKTIPKLDGGALIALAGVGKNAGSIKLHTVFEVLFVWDDFLDHSGQQEFKRFEQWSKIIDCFVAVLEGAEWSTNEMNENCGDVVDRHQGFFKLIREEALHAAKKWDASPTPFLDEMVTYVKSLRLEACLEWSERRRLGSHMFQRVQKHIRQVTSASVPMLESFALVDGIKLSSLIRENFLFQTFKGLVREHVATFNDILSFPKEFSNGEVSNALILLHVEKDLSMEDSLRAIEAELNSVTCALIETGELLLDLFQHDVQLARYVKLAKAMITGHMLWYSYTGRYIDDFVLDMIVH